MMLPPQSDVGSKLFIWDAELFKIALKKRQLRVNPVIGAIDDDAMILEFVSVVLTPKYVVATATNVEDGLKLYNRDAPDLLLLDVEMPGQSGMDLLKALRGFDPNARVIMVTAHNTENVVHQAKDLGASGYIVKPFTADKLQKYIGTHL